MHKKDPIIHIGAPGQTLPGAVRGKFRISQSPPPPPRSKLVTQTQVYVTYAIQTIITRAKTMYEVLIVCSMEAQF